LHTSVVGFLHTWRMPVRSWVQSCSILVLAADDLLVYELMIVIIKSVFIYQNKRNLGYKIDHFILKLQNILFKTIYITLLQSFYVFVQLDHCKTEFVYRARHSVAMVRLRPIYYDDVYLINTFLLIIFVVEFQNAGISSIWFLNFYWYLM
jgi:hypothetical protein